MPTGHRRTRCRKQRKYERRRRTRRARFQQHGGDDRLRDWFTAAAPLHNKAAIEGMQFAELKKDPELTLRPNDPTGPKFEKYFPSSLGDIITNIAVRLGTPIKTGTEFAGVMEGLFAQSPDAYGMLVQLERDLEIEFTDPSVDPSGALPDLKLSTPATIPFLWIAYANLASTEEQQIDPSAVLLPVLIPGKTLTEAT
jgi:hypothetical protein